jgi:excisionase family DNA binding protein
MADNDLATDLLDGIPAIAAFLGLPLRRTYELAEKKRLPLFKLGGRKWLGRKSTLKRHIEGLDTSPAGNGGAA